MPRALSPRAPRSLVIAIVSVCIVSAAVTGRASERREPAPPALVYPVCGQVATPGVGGDTLTLVPGSSYRQPLPACGNIASIQPSVRGYYSSATLAVHEWDPVSLAPDPSTITLRTRGYSASDLSYGWTKFDLVPPLVTVPLDHVADPPRGTHAWTWSNTYAYSGGTHQVFYARAGDGSWPAARYATPFADPLPGSHPVLNESVCLGDATLQGLRLAQVIDHNDAVYDQTWDSFALRFRVPAAVRLRWIELPFAPTSGSAPTRPGTVAVLDAQGQSRPPYETSSALVQADFATYTLSASQWGSHNDFDAIPMLEPHHDYWLIVRTAGQVSIRARTRRGDEGADYVAGIGEMYARHASLDPWALEPDRAIGFRMIGEPVSPVGAPVPHAAPLALRVSPNPVRGETVVQWSGTTGTVSLDVLDVRGRRVGGGRLDAAGATSWRWRAVDANGAPLPAGVYFVRASDGAGREGMQRVVVVR